MDFELKDVMDAVGPSAGLVFAAWLFMHLLQQRYSEAYARYRELIEAMRGDFGGKRREMLKEQVDVYHRRVLYMVYATTLGMSAAVLLLVALIVSALDAIFALGWLKYVGAPAIVLGLALVIPAAILVICENVLIEKPIQSELADMEEFGGQAEAGPKRGSPERERVKPPAPAPDPNDPRT